MQYSQLKSTYVTFLTKVLKTNLPFDADIVCHFFEKLPLLFAPLDQNLFSWTPAFYEHFKLIVHELFLYTISIALKQKSYDFIADIMHANYYLKDRNSSSRDRSDFTAFKLYYNVIDNYYKKLKAKNFYSVHAEIIITNIAEGCTKEQVIESDLLCFYIAKLHGKYWFPVTYVYGPRMPLDFFIRLHSLKYFEKVKGVLNVENLDELKDKLTTLSKDEDWSGYSGGARSITTLESTIKVKEIGISR